MFGQASKQGGSFVAMIRRADYCCCSSFVVIDPDRLDILIGDFSRPDRIGCCFHWLDHWNDCCHHHFLHFVKISWRLGRYQSQWGPAGKRSEAVRR